MFPVKVHDSTIFTKTRYLFQKESKATVKQKMLNHFFSGEKILMEKANTDFHSVLLVNTKQWLTYWAASNNSVV